MNQSKIDFQRFFSIIAILVMALTLPALLTSCKKEEEEKKKKNTLVKNTDEEEDEVEDDSPSEEVPASYSYTCDKTLTANMSASDFANYVESGASSASPFVVCIEPGVVVNSDAANPVTLVQKNYIITSKGDSPATLKYLFLAPTSAGSVMRFENINILDNDAHDAYAVQTAYEGRYEFVNVTAIASGSSDVVQDYAGDFGQGVVTVYIEDSTFSQAGVGGSAINSYNDRWQTFNLDVRNSILVASDYDTIFMDGAGGDVNIQNSSISSLASSCAWCGSGFFGIDLNSITITDSSFYTKKSEGFRYESQSAVGGAATIVITGNTFYSDYNYGVLRFGPNNDITFSNNTIIKGDLAEYDYYAIEVLDPSTYGNATINGSGNTYCNIDPNTVYFTAVVSGTYAWDGTWSPPDISSKPTCP